MKTKFFKKLSLVLALAMVLSVFAPVAGAFAAKAPKLNSTNKYLHLGRVDKGQNKFNFNINNKEKGWSYYWESSDERIATVNEKNGVVTAKKAGKAKISVEITDADGEEVDTLVATVTVRDNIKTVKISNPAKDPLKVGEAYDFNRSYVTEANKTSGSQSVTRWRVEPEGAEIDDKGVFVASKAGEYTVTAYSFQSKARYNAWAKDPVANAGEVLDSDSTTVVVAGSMLDPKQVSLDTVKVLFDSAMTDIEKNLSIHQLVGETKVKQLIKKVAVADDKKSADVTLYVPFSTGAKYVVDYTGLDSVRFDAATTNIEDVAAIEITTSQAELNTSTEVKFRLLNADNVDITTPSLAARVSLKSDNAVGTFFDGKNITIFNKDTMAKITATFHTGKYDQVGNEIGARTHTAVVVGVDKPTTNITGLNAWTMVNNNDPKFDDVKQQIAVGDGDFRLFVEFKTLTGSDEKKINSKDEFSKFDFTTSDKNILIVDQMGNLYPVAEGDVIVVVSYGNAGSRTTIGAIPIHVSAKRSVGTYTLSKYNVTLTNSVGISQTDTVKINLKDQLGADYPYSDIEVKKLTGPTQPEGISEVTTTGYQGKPANGEIVFSGAGRAAGEYAFQVTVEGKVAVVSVTVLDGTGTVSYNQLSLGATSVDVKADKDNKGNKDISIEIIGYNNKGVKATSQALAGGNFKIEVEAPWNYDLGGFDTTTKKYALAKGTSGSAVVKAPTGNYKVTAYELKDHDGKAETPEIWVAFDVQYFTVTDSQTKPVLAEVKNRLFTQTIAQGAIVDNSTDGLLIQAVKDCFKFTLNGTETTAIQSVDAFGTADEFSVKAVTIRETIEGGAYIDHKINVGYTISK